MAENDLNKVMDAYAELEQGVRQVIGGLFGSVCALCTSTCCTADICEESLDSAFLRALRERCQPDAVFCDRYGWLGERGCILKCGRPPVCYGFFCNEILDSLTEAQRINLRTLGRIISQVGERALGGNHLVEIMNVADLQRLNCDRLLRRIADGQRLLAEVATGL